MVHPPMPGLSSLTGLPLDICAVCAADRLSSARTPRTRSPQHLHPQGAHASLISHPGPAALPVGARCRSCPVSGSSGSGTSSPPPTSTPPASGGRRRCRDTRGPTEGRAWRKCLGGRKTSSRSPGSSTGWRAGMGKSPSAPIDTSIRPPQTQDRGCPTGFNRYR